MAIYWWFSWVTCSSYLQYTYICGEKAPRDIQALCFHLKTIHVFFLKCKPWWLLFVNQTAGFCYPSFTPYFSCYILQKIIQIFSTAMCISFVTLLFYMNCLLRDNRWSTNHRETEEDRTIFQIVFMLFLCLYSMHTLPVPFLLIYAILLSFWLLSHCALVTFRFLLWT